jgi:hypothetical protein
VVLSKKPGFAIPGENIDDKSLVTLFHHLSHLSSLYHLTPDQMEFSNVTATTFHESCLDNDEYQLLPQETKPGQLSGLESIIDLNDSNSPASDPSQPKKDMELRPCHPDVDLLGDDDLYTIHAPDSNSSLHSL